MEVDNQTLKLYPAWKEAIKVLLNNGLTFGSVISKDHLTELCKIPPAKDIDDVDRFKLDVLQAITSIKQALLYEHRMFMHSTGSGKYTIVLPADQTQVALDVGRKAVKRAVENMSDGVSYVRSDLLSSKERAENTDAQAKISQLGGMIKQQIAQIGN